MVTLQNTTFWNYVLPDTLQGKSPGYKAYNYKFWNSHLQENPIQRAWKCHLLPSGSSHRHSLPFCTRNIFQPCRGLGTDYSLLQVARGTQHWGETSKSPPYTLQAVKGKNTRPWEHSAYLRSGKCTYSQLTRPHTCHLLTMDLYILEDIKKLFADTALLFFRSSVSLHKYKNCALNCFSWSQKKSFLVKASLFLNSPSLPPPLCLMVRPLLQGLFLCQTSSQLQRGIFINMSIWTPAYVQNVKNNKRGLADTTHISYFLKLAHLFSFEREADVIIGIFTFSYESQTSLHCFTTCI